MNGPPRSVQMDQFKVPCFVDGRGPLIVCSYVLGRLAWGSLEKLKECCTVAVIDWLESSAPVPFQASYSWFPDFVKSLDFREGALCSWSMGAPSLIPYAASKPRELSRLVLVDPAGLGGRPPTGLRDRLGILSVKLARRPTRMHIKNMWRHWVRNPDLNTRPLIDAHLRFLSAQSQARALADSPSLESTRSSTNRVGSPIPGGLPSYDALVSVLAEIEVPTILLTGRHSTVLGPELGLTAVGQLSRGELVIFEESSHSLQLEETGRFQQVVGDFMTKGAST